MIKSKLHKLSFLATSVLFANAAHAFFPFVTDDTGTQGRGGSQIEFDYGFEKSHDDEISEDDGRVIGTATGISNAFSSTYTYGVTENVDVFAGLAYQSNAPRGWQNTEIGAKWVFAGDQTKGWSTAIKPSVLLPVTKSMQDNGLGSADTNLSLTLVSSYLADTHELHINAGYASNWYKTTELTPSGSERTNLWSVSAAPVLVLNNQWKAGLDLGISTNPNFDSDYTVFGEIGLQYSPLENLQFGLGLMVNSNVNSTTSSWNYQIATGLAYQF